MGIQITSLYEWHLKKRENAQYKLILSGVPQKVSTLSFLFSGRQWKNQGFFYFLL